MKTRTEKRKEFRSEEKRTEQNITEKAKGKEKRRRRRRLRTSYTALAFSV